MKTQNTYLLSRNGNKYFINEYKIDDIIHDGM